MKLFVLAVLAASAAPAAAAPDWRFVGREGADTVRYLDADSIKRSDDVVAFWTMTVRGPTGSGGEVTDMLSTADCKTHAYKLLQSRENPATTLRQPTWVVAFRSEWRRFGAGDRLPPGSPLRAIIDMACGAAEIGAPAVAAAAPARTAEQPASAVPPTPSPSSAPAAAAGVATWVYLGAAVTGQAIALDVASAARQAGVASGWFRLINSGEAAPGPVSYLLRIDCAARTINQMGLRRHGPAGEVTEERDYGPAGEGAVPVEAETVMEVAHRGLCAPGLGSAAASPPPVPARPETAPPAPEQ